MKEPTSRHGDWVDELSKLVRLALTDHENKECYNRKWNVLAKKHGYVARLRDDETLVLYPENWVDEGKVQPTKIEDINQAIEVSIFPRNKEEEKERWTQAHNRNRELFASFKNSVDDELHLFNAEVFADFVENHYLLSVEDVNNNIVQTFLNEYYPRNVWPPEGAEKVVDQSIQKYLDFVGLDIDFFKND